MPDKTDNNKLKLAIYARMYRLFEMFQAIDAGNSGKDPEKYKWDLITAASAITDIKTESKEEVGCYQAAMQLFLDDIDPNDKVLNNGNDEKIRKYAKAYFSSPLPVLQSFLIKIDG